MRYLLVLVLLAPACPKQMSVCATGEVLTDKGCQCSDGHVPDEDGVGCHREDPTTTTTTTSTSTTTSTTTTTLRPATPVPPSIPPIAPSPTPTCIPEPAMPSGPVTTANGLAASSCEHPSENMACFKDRGDVAIYVEGETRCWNYAQYAAFNLNAGHWKRERRGNMEMLCDEPPRGCFDKFGRRYSNDDWTRECFGSDCRQPSYPFSGQYAGICPARAPKTCPPVPLPTPTVVPGESCTLPAMRECGSVGNVNPVIGLYGCCVTDKHPSFPRESPFSSVLADVQEAEERDGTVARDRDGRVDEDAYVNEILRRLRVKGLCVTRGGPSDEIGIKGSNAESWQFDIHLSNGRPRKGGYVAYCKPARF